MSTIRRRIVTPIAIAIAVAIGPTLSGCFGMTGNPIEGVIEGATGGNIDIGGTSLPNGFPEADVPLYDGDIVAGMAVGNADGKVFNVSVRVPDASVLEEITSGLEDAGFTADGGFVASNAGGGSAVYLSDTWSVFVVVTSDGSESWTANYTVSTVGAR